ncbi:hypothetical protein FBEOM_14660 [Fusarium beomiforme]|uniref:Uncharacterized protein n=1 Tax=Fusarium beomiforme TaxID=44412 RepID=A0A9P5DLP3_9HYPO|nr:hypothetical protein FBEOM_14660 [Fusarium beomiforme]
MPPRKKRQLSVDPAGSGTKTEAELHFINQTAEFTERHALNICSTPSFQGSSSLNHGFFENTLAEDEAVQRTQGLPNQPLLYQDDSLQASTILNAIELLSYTSLPELLSSTEDKGTRSGTIRSPGADVPLFDISEFVTFSPTLEPAVSESHLAINHSQDVLVDDATLTTCDEQSAHLSTDWSENDDAQAPVQDSSDGSLLDESIVDTNPALHQISSPKSEPMSCNTT